MICLQRAHRFAVKLTERPLPMIVPQVFPGSGSGCMQQQTRPCSEISLLAFCAFDSRSINTSCFLMPASLPDIPQKILANSMPSFISGGSGHEKTCRIQFLNTAGQILNGKILEAFYLSSFDFPFSQAKAFSSVKFSRQTESSHHDGTPFPIGWSTAFRFS